MFPCRIPAAARVVVEGRRQDGVVSERASRPVHEVTASASDHVELVVVVWGGGVRRYSGIGEHRTRLSQRVRVPTSYAPKSAEDFWRMLLYELEGGMRSA